MIKRLLYFLVLAGLAVSFYIWGYFTYSRKVFPYKIVSSEYKMASKELEQKEKEFRKASAILKKIDAYNLIKIDNNNKDSLHKFVIQTILGQPGLPNEIPAEPVLIEDERYKIENLEKIEKLSIDLKGVLTSNVYIFNPLNNKNNKVFIYHEGHAGDFINGYHVIEHFVNKGYTVFGMSMPLLGSNTVTLNWDHNPEKYLNHLPFIPIDDGHQTMRYLEHPLYFYIAPVIQVINFAVNKRGFDQVFMAGLSGGGWTTHLAAAVDSRIVKSFAVAGSYPNYIRVIDRSSEAWGDFEQTYFPLFKYIDYLDLYVMACSQNRYHYQVLNKYDPCCFKNEWGILYEKAVIKKNLELGYGKFEIFVDDSHKKHIIGPNTIKYINKEIEKPIPVLLTNF